MAKDFIICCDCGDTYQYSVDAHRLMSHGAKTPDVYRHNKAHKLLDKLDNNTNVYKFVASLIKGKGKFSYYVEYDDNGDVTEQWNLLSGQRTITKGER